MKNSKTSSNQREWMEINVDVVWKKTVVCCLLADVLPFSGGWRMFAPYLVARIVCCSSYDFSSIRANR